MKKNVGTVDKIIRLLIALLIAVLYFTGVISGTLAIVLGIIAIAMVLTSLINFCGLYTLLGISTCPAAKRK
jgi:hypothetical protein